MKDSFSQDHTIIPTRDELQIILDIRAYTQKQNLDNITRTRAYLEFYLRHPEISWAFLASMVSRNGGWNMCDLEGEWLPKLIPEKKRQTLFLTLEKANWLIFQDAFPQLLLYHYSTKVNRPMFHLLKFFSVSSFMEREWNEYWRSRDGQRLLTALIINEQNVIQKPVINHPVYRHKVFRSVSFLFQDWLHFSTVLFPTIHGELYGASVNDFRSVDKRINLGKRLAKILFLKELFPRFLEFAVTTEHTGSRIDYEQYFIPKKKRTTPFLRVTYPVVSHSRHECIDWSLRKGIKKSWLVAANHKEPIQLKDWYLRKQKQMQAIIALTELFKH